jgi:biopolymer transport protein ExbB/TolQ
MSFGIFNAIATAFREGGIWMVFIMVAQVVSLIIIAERVFALYIQRKPNQKNLVGLFERDIKSGQLDRVIAQAQSLVTTNPAAVVVQAGAQAARDMGGKEEIQLKIDEVLLEEQSRIEKRTAFLAMLGNVGTLLGLLGTIVGLIRAFASVGAASPVEKAAILSQGVSEAMYATAYGLIAALPALIMFAVLQNRAHQLSEDLSKAALKLYIWLGFNYETVTDARERRA